MNFAIIIPFYNRENVVAEAFASAFFQNYEKLDIILIDDGSSDESYYILNQLIKDYKELKNIIFNLNSGIKKFNSEFRNFIESINEYKITEKRVLKDIEEISIFDNANSKEIKSLFYLYDKKYKISLNIKKIKIYTIRFSRVNRHYFRKVILIKIEKNLGQGISRNLGIIIGLLNKNNIFSFLDSDDIMKINYLKSIIENWIKTIKREFKVNTIKKYFFITQCFYFKDNQIKNIKLEYNFENINKISNFNKNLFYKSLIKNIFSVSGLILNLDIILSMFYKYKMIFHNDLEIFEDYYLFLNLIYNFKPFIINSKNIVVRKSSNLNNLTEIKNDYEYYRIIALIDFYNQNFKINKCNSFILNKNTFNNLNLLDSNFCKESIRDILIKKYKIWLKGAIKRKNFEKINYLRDKIKNIFK